MDAVQRNLGNEPIKPRSSTRELIKIWENMHATEAGHENYAVYKKINAFRELLGSCSLHWQRYNERAIVRYIVRSWNTRKNRNTVIRTNPFADFAGKLPTRFFSLYAQHHKSDFRFVQLFDRSGNDVLSLYYYGKPAGCMVWEKYYGHHEGVDMATLCTWAVHQCISAGCRIMLMEADVPGLEEAELRANCDQQGITLYWEVMQDGDNDCHQKIYP